MVNETRKQKETRLKKSIAETDKKLHAMDKSKFAKGDINKTPPKKDKHGPKIKGDALLRSGENGNLGRTATKPIYDFTNQKKERANRRIKI